MRRETETNNPSKGKHVAVNGAAGAFALGMMFGPAGFLLGGIIGMCAGKKISREEAEEKLDSCDADKHAEEIASDLLNQRPEAEEVDVRISAGVDSYSAPSRTYRFIREPGEIPLPSSPVEAKSEPAPPTLNFGRLCTSCNNWTFSESTHCSACKKRGLGFTLFNDPSLLFGPRCSQCRELLMPHQNMLCTSCKIIQSVLQSRKEEPPLFYALAAKNKTCYFCKRNLPSDQAFCRNCFPNIFSPGEES